MLELLCKSKNKFDIYYDPVNSHAATHFEDTNNLKELVIEVLQNTKISNEKLDFTIDTGRFIGTSDVVEVDDTDEVIYAIRRNRADQDLVPFTKTKLAQPESKISISLILIDDGKYELSSAWIGDWDDPPFPMQPNANNESIPYWSTHAFVWGSQEIEPGTETPVKPW